jgi:hypothetical protein
MAETTTPPCPVWTRVDLWEWSVTSVTASGAEVTRRVRKYQSHFGKGGGWYVLEDGQRPWWLANRIDDAKDEFLLAFHGWKRPFGFVDGDGTRPIYGKGQQRRERAELLAEIKAAYRNQRKGSER